MPKLSQLQARQTDANIPWGDEFQKRAEQFLRAVLAFDKHPDKIKAQWKTGNPEPHHLEVEWTTKCNLLQIIHQKNQYSFSDDDKRAIYDSTRRLEILGILKKKPYSNQKNEDLRFFLALPSRNIEEIINWVLQEKWLHKKKNNNKAHVPSNDGSLPLPDSSVMPSSSVEIHKEKGKKTIARVVIKLEGNLEDADPQTIKAILDQEIYDFMRMFIKPGSILVEFECSLESFNEIASKINNGQLTEIAGFPILDIQKISEIESVELTQWFDNIKVDDWLYDIGVQAAKLALKSYRNLTGNIGATAPTTLRGGSTPVTPIIDAIVFSGILGAAAFWRGNNPSQDNPSETYSSNTSQNGQLSLTDLIEDVLNSNNKYSILMSAYELGKLLENVSNIPQDFINLLATRINNIEDSETRWQLALTLGKLEPEHPLGAVGQTKTIEFTTDDWFDLFLALRVGEDDLIDVLIEVTSATDEYLPVGLQVSLLDETEEIFSEVVANEDDRYLSLEFTEAIGKFFSVKFSLGGNDLIENFVI